MAGRRTSGFGFGAGACDGSRLVKWLSFRFSIFYIFGGTNVSLDSTIIIFIPRFFPSWFE